MLSPARAAAAAVLSRPSSHKHLRESSTFAQFAPALYFFVFSLFARDRMYQDTFEEDDLVAEVELVAQARYSTADDLDDGFDAEGTVHTSV